MGTALPSLPRPLVQLHLLNNHAKDPNFDPAQAADPWCSSSAGVREGEDLCHSSRVTPANPCQPPLLPEDKPGMSDLGGHHKTSPEPARACAARSGLCSASGWARGHGPLGTGSKHTRAAEKPSPEHHEHHEDHEHRGVCAGSGAAQCHPGTQ